MNRLNIFIISLCVASFAAADGDSLRVKITPSIDTVVVKHADKSITIMRHQDPNNKVNPTYAKTSRDCPPFCIQPMVMAPGVETIGELEVLDYLRRIGDGDDSVIVIDSRTEDWVANGTIPGAVNIPWTTLSPSAGADPFEVAEILELRFGAISQEGLWNYANAKTLVLFCNGMWCGQSPTNIKALVNFGYPPHKLKWYRGGMQSWEVLGLTVAH